MPDIRHRVVISAPRGSVYQAVATTQGLSDWWTRGGVQGESEEGSALKFFFGGPEAAAIMEVLVLDADTHVAWRCVGGAEEWVGTSLDFSLSSSDEGTVVLFSHADWRSPTDFMAHCSARWAYFLLSLKRYAETGAGTPFPDDLKF